MIGALPVEIVRLWTSQTDNNREIVLTGKQRQHYEMRPLEAVAWKALLTRAVLDPDEVHRNRDDAAIAIFYKRIDAEYSVRVAVLMQRLLSARKHSLLSYRLAGKREIRKNRNRMVWKPA
ncbi:MAG: hypothetical protein ACR2PL_06845 [Dehalococcoidia bacterium]